MRRTLATLAVVLCTLSLASGCGDDDDTSSAEPTTRTEQSEPTESSEPTEPSESTDQTQQIEVTFSGDSVTPNGDRVEVPLGEPVELVVEADQPGEIHVHSSPEQEFEYDAGSTTLTIAAIDRPGVVEVESHTLEKTIVQLEVR